MQPSNQIKEQIYSYLGTNKPTCNMIHKFFWEIKLWEQLFRECIPVKLTDLQGNGLFYGPDLTLNK